MIKIQLFTTDANGKHKRVKWQEEVEMKTALAQFIMLHFPAYEFMITSTIKPKRMWRRDVKIKEEAVV